MREIVMMIISVLVLVIIIMQNSKCYGRRIYCVKPDNYSTLSCPHSYKIWQWSDVIENSTYHFASHRKIYFLPGMYKLNNHLAIAHATDLSLIGFGGNAATIFNCTTGDGGIVSIHNSTLVLLQNITLINCGMPVNDFGDHYIYNVSFPLTTRTVLFAYRVLSLTIDNVIFENPQGNGIIGLNALGDIVLKHIIIQNTLQTHSISRDSRARGFVFIYNDDVQLNTMHSVCMSNNHFLNLRNMNDKHNTASLVYTDSIVISLAFHQMNYHVTVEIQDTKVENITSKTLPLISILYKPLSQNTVNLMNIMFIGNTITDVKGSSLFSIQSSWTSVSERSLIILINKCTFLNNSLSVWNTRNQNTLMALKVMLISTEFRNNTGIKDQTKLWILNFVNFLELTIQDCKFILNTNSALEFRNIKILRFIGRNVFQNNSAIKSLLSFSSAYPQFKGYYDFSYNVANSILSIYRYITLLQNTTIKITNNKASGNKKDQNKHWAPIHVGTRHTLFDCSFQFNITNYQMLNVHIIVLNNTNYVHKVYGTQMNSCHWHKNIDHNTTPGEVYNNVFLHNSSQQYYINRDGAMLCHCKTDTEVVDCFKDHFQPIFPGQTTNISIFLLPTTTQTAVHIDSSVLLKNSFYPPCEFPSSKIYLVSNRCTSVSFKIKFNSITQRSCSMYLKTTSTPATLFIYYFDHKECPIGFQFIGGSCDCHSYLKAVFPNLKCDIDKQVLTRPPNTWIGISHTTGNNTLHYVEHCVEHFCLEQFIDIQLNHFDAQCVNNRVGIMCGHCATGYDSVFGSFACKKCSNYWLFLLPVFMLAGLLLVLSLFLLNITVVHGNINGFILYVNVLVGNNYTMFPKRNITFVLMSLINLDVGIETCFYHGMTEYDKTWLLFSFPVYLLLIVAMLAYASRYSSSIEKLTRRRVIPVIATIFLLSHNKLLLATTKVLFSYKTVYQLNDTYKQVIWMWDSSVPLIGVKFFCLFLTCLVVFLVFLVPFNFILLFTKFFYRFKFVVNYIRPYVDAFQAPFKDNFRYFFGLELIIRSIYFTIGNRILDNYQTLGLTTLICTLYLVYLCIFQPFKSTVNNVLYVSYAINAEFVAFILTFNNLTNTTSYNIMFNVLVLIAFLEFSGTILYSLYITHVKKIMKENKIFDRALEFITKHLHDKPKTTESLMTQFSSKDLLQEELLAVEYDFS